MGYSDSIDRVGNQAAQRHKPVGVVVLAIGLWVSLIGAAWCAVFPAQLQTPSHPWIARVFNAVHPPIRPTIVPSGIQPNQIKLAYGLTALPTAHGTIAIVDAYDAPTIESDLNVFSTQFGLAPCLISTGCFEKHKMTTATKPSGDWSTEISLDIEWAHAIAPSAHILLVEATSANQADLLSAVDYARQRSDVVAISMSWGGDEFAGETDLEGHFTSAHGASFFASSGDDGYGPSWPAASARVISVGGSSLSLQPDGRLDAESAWTGSGGGLSKYIAEPSYQINFGIAKASGHRAIPDVAYQADPALGYAVYDSTVHAGGRGWFNVGGTSAGAPQWAALRAISSTVTLEHLYSSATKSQPPKLRDILAGRNGSCGFYCQARPGYDFVTGLGSPASYRF